MSATDIHHSTPVTMTDSGRGPTVAHRSIDVGGHAFVHRRRSLVAAVVASIAMMLVASGAASAQNPPDSHRPATWNMQISSSRWGAVYSLSSFHSVVALQEVPGRPPAGAVATGRRVGSVVEYRWQQGRRGPLRYLYILPQRSRNLGMVTSFRANRFFELGNVYRSLLGVYGQHQHDVRLRARLGHRRQRRGQPRHPRP